jgi:hypothetical protein
LYKKIKNVSVPDRKNIGGQMWVRKNSQKVQPGSLALSGIFDTYNNLPLYNELTGNGITQINVFYDTLFIQTTGVILFEKINYDYESDYIFSLEDNAKYLSLALPTEKTLNRELQNAISIVPTVYNYAKAGETWFLKNTKEVFLSVCGLSGSCLRPELYRYNIGNLNFERLFPRENTDKCLIQGLSSLGIVSIEPPLLTFNETKKLFKITVLGKNNIDQDILIDIDLYYYEELVLDQITIFTPVNKNVIIDPPAILHPLDITQSVLSALNFQLTAINTPATYQGINLPPWCTITETGRFIGNIPQPGTFYLPFIVRNNIGPTYYSLILNAVTQ